MKKETALLYVIAAINVLSMTIIAAVLTRSALSFIGLLAAVVSVLTGINNYINAVKKENAQSETESDQDEPGKDISE